VAGLYIHIPFCEHKCNYCDFYSLESLESVSRFLTALDREIEHYAAYGTEEKIDTVYFGGGTPSILSPSDIECILRKLHDLFVIRPDAEITLETNPGTVTEEKLRSFRALGINRISIGIQSFHDEELKFLTRIHSSAEAKRCVDLAYRVGLENVGIDLIFALPGQTMGLWEDNLGQAIALNPHHISAYSLIVEKGTPLSRMVEAKQVSALPLKTEAEMYRFTMEYLQTAGFEHYEVSNYSRPGFRSKHNSNYWNHTPYLGFGPSAHSFWNKRRWWNNANINTYCGHLEQGKLPVAGDERLSFEQLIAETIMLGMRSDGIHVDNVKARYNIDLLTTLSYDIDQLIRDRLLLYDPPMLHLTDNGYLLCDEITGILLRKMTHA
jgi:oxygen-independent coproporphyrinogen-3 oxidase